MKIAYFLDIPIGLGGAGNVLLEQARIMSKIHDVIVVIPCSKDGEVNREYERRCKKAGLRTKTIYYKTTYLPQNIDLLAAIQSAAVIKDFILEAEIDFLHSVQINTAAEIVSRELHKPHLMNIYQLRDEEFCIKNEGIIPRYHSCDSLLYCRLWSENWGMVTKCIRPAALEENIQNREQKKKTELRILMLGDVCKRKNQLAAIQAVEYCLYKGLKVVLTIAGNDYSEYAKICQAYIEEKGLFDVIRLKGFISDVKSLLRENDCFLCTSIEESFPSSIIEAMTYDLTIISTPVAGVPELLINGKNAFISQGFQMTKIAESIEECAEEYRTGNIKEIHKCAKNTWKENFSQKIVRRKLDEYYSYILDKHYSTIADIKRDSMIFAEVQSLYQKLLQADINEPFILQRCYYYVYLQKSLHAGKAYIWGAGNYGKAAKKLVEILFEQIELQAYIDIKKTGEYEGLPIIKFDEMESDIEYVFLGFAGEKERVIEHLQEKKFKYNDNIWLLP
jgi:glycosyltransferase involved in cell wall biosynthesis